MLDWTDELEKIQKENIRFLEVAHVDGQRFKGEFKGIESGSNGNLLVLKGFNGEEIKLNFTTIRKLIF